jgi:two-component system, cell cycle sensor histidine kinase and response regulator CckA
MIEAWMVGLAANAVISVAFLAVAVVLAWNAIKTKQVRHNPLGLAVVILYIGCGGGHVVHTLQFLDVPLGRATMAGYGIQQEYALNGHIWVADILTAAAGVSYWMMRRRFPALVSGAAVFEDLRARQRRALEIHDGVVQGLTRAKLALDLDERKEGEQAVEETLDRARGIITGLLGKEEIKPGALRRRVPVVAGGPGVSAHGR